jgi:anti-sigma regulatory factor (Ser/Thr protein kinase)
MSDQIARNGSSVTAPASTAAFTDLHHQFSVPLSATRRGARLARLLATEQLRSWGLPLEPARLIVAELAGNAATHGRVPGRGFRLTLAVTASTTLRIEVTDTRGDRLPVRVLVTDAAPAEGGYGLLLVEELADRWGVVEEPVPSKTVWAELDLVKRDASLNVALAADSASAGTRL